MVLVLEAPSLEAAQAFVGDSPYARSGTFAGVPRPSMEVVDGTPRLSALRRRSVRRALGGLPEGWLMTDDAELKRTKSERTCFD